MGARDECSDILTWASLICGTLLELNQRGLADFELAVQLRRLNDSVEVMRRGEFAASGELLAAVETSAVVASHKPVVIRLNVYNPLVTRQVAGQMTDPQGGKVLFALKLLGRVDVD